MTGEREDKPQITFRRINGKQLIPFKGSSHAKGKARMSSVIGVLKTEVLLGYSGRKVLLADGAGARAREPSWNVQ